MVIVIDSGSTKSDWRLINGSQVYNASSIGLNPFHASVETISQAIQGINFNGFSGGFSDVQEVNLFGSGVDTNYNRELLEKVFKVTFPRAQIYVKSDMVGAALSVSEGRSGIVAILGTGSNSCLFDGEKIISQQPALGYILGDDGAGSQIGLLAVQAYLNGGMPKDLMEQFEAHFSDRKEEILSAVYQDANPNRYLASYCKWIVNYLDNEFVWNLAQNSMSRFFEFHISKYTSYDKEKLSVVGSIGHYFRPVLEAVCAKFSVELVNVVQKPIDGLSKKYLN